MKERIKRLREVKKTASMGGGAEKIAKEHEKGKLSARERINLLLDPDSFNEFNMLVKYRMGAPGDGIVVGHGTIDGRRICVFAHDATVMGGSQGYMHGRKLYKIHEMALDMGVPLIGLNDSPGARVIRHEVAGSDDPYRVSDEKHAGVVFFMNARCSGVVPQISAILGNCTGGSVYSPALTDFIFMVDGLSHMCITGPRVIKSVMHEDVTLEELGGAKIHCQVTGVADFGIFVEIENTGCEGMVRLADLTDDFYEYDADNFRVVGRRKNKIIGFGNAVRVKIKATDLERRSMDLELVSVEGSSFAIKEGGSGKSSHRGQSSKGGRKTSGGRADGKRSSSKKRRK